MKHLVYVLIGIMILGLMVFGFSNNGLFSLSEEDPVKIGVMLPLTGVAASWGEPAKEALLMAEHEYNLADSRDIKLIFEDDGCDAEQSVKGINKLINVDQVDALIGFVCSTAAEPTLSIINSNKVPLVIPIASAPGLSEKGEYIFRVTPADDLQGRIAAEYVYESLGKRKVSIIYENDPWGKGLNNSFTEKFESLGGDIVYSTGILHDSKDLKNELIKARDEGSDLVYMPVLPSNTLKGIKDMSELSIDLPIILGDGSVNEDVFASEDSQGLVFLSPNFNVPEDYISRIKSMDNYNGVSITYASPISYDDAKVLYNAIDRANSLSSNKIKAELVNTNYRGVSNPIIEFDKYGDLKSGEFVINKIENGKSVSIN